mgnify:CR=1 FL=1
MVNINTRNIIKPKWDNEQVVHHILMRQLIPILQPKLYRFSCGSVKGRGAHSLLKVMKSWVRSYNGKRFYVAELDIRKFYDNVKNDILKTKINRLIRDKRYNETLFKVIGDNNGIAKGNYTSPWLAHLYLMDMDNHILQDLKPDHYARYVDNMWLFSCNKKRLRRMVSDLNQYLFENLMLTIKSDWQVFRFDDTNGNGRAINLLGFVVHRNRVCIRKSILKRIRAKANRVYNKGRTTIKDACSIVSRLGYFKYSNAYRYYLRHIKTKISVRYLKRRIRNYMKRGKQHDRLETSLGRRTAT